MILDTVVMIGGVSMMGVSYSPPPLEWEDLVEFEVFEPSVKGNWFDFNNDTFKSQIGEENQEVDSKTERGNPGTVNDSNACKEHEIVHDASNNLSNDFLSALQKSSFTDVSIKCDDYIQQAHRLVLAARSPVFEDMFSTSMEENEIGEMTIYDTDSLILKNMLDFIYSAQIQNMTLSKACGLLHATEKYQVSGLKDICINYLRSCLSIQTALTILPCADTYDKELKDDTISYVCENFSALKTTKEWKTLQSQKPHLCIEVYSMVVEKYEKKILEKYIKSIVTGCIRK